MPWIAAQEYLPFADDLTDGAQININHDECTAGQDRKRRLYITRKQDKFLAYCHHCGGAGVYTPGWSKKYRSLSELKKGIVVELEEDKAAKLGTNLPEDIVWDPNLFHTEAKLWLYKYGIDDAEIMGYGIGYSSEWHRVFLTVCLDKPNNRAMFWQARSVDGQEPKYLSSKGVDKPCFYTYTHNPKQTLFICEDILSAIKLARHTDAVALLGTKLPIEAVAHCRRYDKIVIYMDHDQAGREAAQQINEQLTLLMGPKHKVSTFLGTKQPKELSSKEIEELVAMYNKS